MERPLRAALLAEVYGTFVLVFLGPLSITIATNPQVFTGGLPLGLGFVGLAHGVAILVGIAAVAAISGAHFNPAVTIGLAYSGRFPKNRVLPYILAQLVGATVAALTQLAMVGVNVAKTTDLGSATINTNPAIPYPVFAAVLAEIVGTMILVITILGSTDKDAPGWGPSTIGLSIAAVIWAVGGISGASLNPARSFGPSLVSLLFDPSSFANYWIYVVGPILGALLASEIYRAMQRR